MVPRMLSDVMNLLIPRLGVPAAVAVVANYNYYHYFVVVAAADIDIANEIVAVEL